MPGACLRVALLVCNIGVAFYLMPFIIHALGNRMYGFWTLIGTFLGYYGLLDLGLSSAVSRFVSRAFGQQDYDEMNYVINTSLVLFGFVGLVALVISIIAMLLCPFFIQNASEALLFRKVIFILGCSIAIGFPMRALSGVLTAQIRYDLISCIELVKLFIRTLFIVIFISKGYGILALAIITFVVETIGHIINFRLVKRCLPQLRLTLSLVNVQKIRLLFSYSKYTFIAQIADHLRFKVDSFIIAGFLNLSMVTPYYIATRLIDYFGQFIVSAVGMMSPVFSQYESRGDFESIRKWFLQVTRLSVILSFFGGSSIIFYGGPFIERWMGLDYKSSYYVLLILSVSSIAALMQNPSIGLLYGISKHKYYAISNSCEGILNLILSIILVKYYGIYGVAMGTAIEMIIFKLFIQPIYTCRVIKLSLYKYYFQTVFITAVKTMLPVLVYFYIIRNLLVSSFLTIFALSTLQIILFLPILLIFILEKREQQYIKMALGITSS